MLCVIDLIVALTLIRVWRAAQAKLADPTPP